MAYFYGGTGNDALQGSEGNDVMLGYGGDDSLKGKGGNDEIYGGDAVDTLVGGGGNDHLDGGADSDTLKGGGGNDTMMGGAGNDTLISQAGSDTMDGGEGDDEYRVTSKDEGTADTYQDTGTGGHDVVDATRVAEMLLAGDFDAGSGIEEIQGSAEDKLSIISDGSAVNWDFTGIELVNVKQIVGSGEDDVITGSGGNNKIKGGEGSDELNGGDGEDNLAGGGDDDTLNGDADDDKLNGSGGDDAVYGGAGNDSLQGGEGNDYLDGGEGSDTYVYKEGERLGDDDVMDTGVAGHDVVDLTKVTAMELGETVIAAGSGIEEIHGNEVDGTELHAGDYAVEWNFGGLEMNNITKITASEHDDEVVGSDSADKIVGGGGNDYIAGGEGDDNLSGSAGDDSMFGDEGDDILKGGGGDDLLAGGAGNDNLKGGGGNDTLAYDAGDGKVNGQEGTDTLSLDGSEGVTLELSGLSGTTLLDIEIIDLGGNGNTLVLDKTAVKDLSETSDTLVVKGDATDAVTSDFAWEQGEDADGYHVYTSGAVTLKVQDGVDVSGFQTTADDPPVLDVNIGAQFDGAVASVITAAMLSASDIDSGDADVFYTLTILPAHGSVLVNNVALTEGGTFTQADLVAGLVEYENSDASATEDEFTFTLSDAGNNDIASDMFGIVINAIISGTTGGDVLDGGAGDDTLYGGLGNDVLTGGYGDDALYGGDGLFTDVLYGNAGNDVLIGEGGYEIFYGGPGVDVLYGGAQDDFYWIMDAEDLDDAIFDSGTLGSNDYLHILTDGTGLAGQSYQLAEDVERVLIHGNSDFSVTGNDLGNSLDATMFAAGGNYVIDGGAGNDEIQGGSGNDTLIGGAGDDQLFGADGDDLLIVGDGASQFINGGDGIDTADFSAYEGEIGIFLDGGPGSLQLIGMPAGSITNVENVVGTANADSIGGNGSDNVLTGGGGADGLGGQDGDDTLFGGEGGDSLSGGSGDDMLDGGMGDDFVTGGAGNDILIGGEGTDLLQYDDANYSVIVNLAEGTASRSGEDDVLSGFENVTAGSGDDEIVGSAEANILRGGNGNDILSGEGGTDTLRGGSGNDTLDGGAAGDYYYFDTALFDNTDTILSFDGAGISGGDVIVLNPAIFTVLSAGVMPPSYFASVTDPTSYTPGAFIIYENDTGMLYYDADGDGSISTGGTAYHFATLGGVPAIGAGDFTIFGG